MLAESKVGQFDVPFAVYENIVRLEVAMDEVDGVYAFYREDGLGDVETTLLLAQDVFPHK